MTLEEMDRVVEQHFAMEARADIDGILATFTDDIEHDVVGAPGGPLRGKAAARRFYEALTRELPATDAIPRHRYHGDNVLVDEVLWEARADGRTAGRSASTVRGGPYRCGYCTSSLFATG